MTVDDSWSLVGSANWDTRSFRLNFDEPPRFEMDGDVRQAADAEVRVRILPGVLTIVAPVGS